MLIVAERFAAKVVAVPGGCEYWVGAIGDDGYGRFEAAPGVTVKAHRWIWEQRHGPIPEGVYLLHSCDETLCVADDHHRLGTQAENQQQMARRGRGAGPHHRGLGDTRGPYGRALAIRAALIDGYDLERLAAAIAAGDPHRFQLRLFP